jgi:TniQ
MSNLTVPLGKAETPWSFTSRLAARNGLNASEFCLDWEVRFSAVVNGDRQAIETIAEFGGVATNHLAAYSFNRLERKLFEHRGQRLTQSSLRCGRIYICPACLKDDIRTNPKLSPNIAVYHRALWMIDAIKTCPSHNLALVPLADPANIRKTYDFTLRVGPEIDHLNRLETQTSRQQPSGLEHYITRRLGGSCQSSFLDSLELFAAIKTCSMIGAVDLFERSLTTQKFTDADWYKAGGRGFKIAAGGPAAIEAFLDVLHASFDFGHSGLEGPAAIYGSLYKWLALGPSDAAYDPIRQIVGQHIRGHLPLAAGHPVFREPIEKRVLHSIRSLSFEADLHPQRLRRILKASGIISARQATLPDQHVVFAAEAASSLVEKAKGALSLPEAGEYLNAPRVQAALLVKNKFIEPHVAAGAAGALDRYATADLDAFLRRLLGGSAGVSKPKTSYCSIPVAAKLACCSAAEIINLVLGKKLGWTGKLTGAEGYLSLLVDVREIKLHIRGPEHGGISLRKAASMLETNDQVLRALINCGHIKTFMAVNPVNRCPQVLISPAEIARFQKTYISLFQLARKLRKHIAAVRAEMKSAGIKPAFDAFRVRATFYLRKDCR